MEKLSFVSKMVFLSVLFMFFAVSSHAEGENGEKPAESGAAATVVTVNGHAITQSQLDDEIDKISQAWKADGMPEAQIEQMLGMYRRQMIESLVATHLIEEACEKKGVSISDAEVKQELDEVEKSLPDGQTLAEIMERYGVTEESLKERIVEQLKLKKLLNLEEPSEAEIRSFYEERVNNDEVRARHILLMVDEDDTKEEKAEKLKKAEDIRKQLAEGADFGELAKKHSDCPSKEQGGDLSYFSKERMVKPFSDAAFALEVDEISDVVETHFGYHIIQTTSKKPAPTFEEAKNNIKRALMEREMRSAAMALVEKLRSEADIVYPGEAESLKNKLPKPLPE